MNIENTHFKLTLLRFAFDDVSVLITTLRLPPLIAALLDAAAAEPIAPFGAGRTNRCGVSFDGVAVVDRSVVDVSAFLLTDLLAAAVVFVPTGASSLRMLRLSGLAGVMPANGWPAAVWMRSFFVVEVEFLRQDVETVS